MCFEQTAGWEDQKEGERNAAVNHVVSLTLGVRKQVLWKGGSHPHLLEGLVLPSGPDSQERSLHKALDTPWSFLLHGFEPDALGRKKARTSLGPPFFKHSEDFFQGLRPFF